MKEKDLEMSDLSKFAPMAAFNTSIEMIVQETLRNAITHGAFYPGQELDEVAIAKDLQISRMPVRQSMSALEAEGLVTRIPRKGVFVTALDKHDLEEIYTTRVALEEVAIRAAIDKFTEVDLQKIEKILAIPDEELLDYAKFLEIDKEFHFLLYAPSGWMRVTKYIQQLRNNTATYRILKAPLSAEQLEISLNDHHAIFDAYRSRNADLAATLLREHTLKTSPSSDE